MTLTVIHNNITFVDAQAMRLTHPGTFEAPSMEDLNEIKKSDFVKVCVNDERFWVAVINIKDDIVTGRVDNDLLQKGIKYNDTIEFPKCCIFSIEEGF